ncbi:metallophosphoesterase [Acidobacteria bacterium AH-259-D05]|nr:metallophosphoesterase [Acidobacteria bacterium AH-259-D05]
MKLTGKLNLWAPCFFFRVEYPLQKNHRFNRTMRLCLGIVGFVIAALLAGSLFSAPSSPMPFTPLPEGGNAESFSFIVYGDIQGNYRNGHQALVNQMLREHATFVVNSGDISPHKGKHYERDFYPVIQKLTERIPYFPSVGNHDVTWKSPYSRYRFINFFHRVYRYLAEREINAHLLDPTTQKLWYSFMYGNVLFIVLDSNLFIDEGRYQKTHSLEPYKNYLREQMIWVRDLLRNSSQNPNIRAKFVFFHHSPFVSDENNPVPLFGWGGHPGHSQMVVNQTVSSDEPGKTLYLLDLFRKHRVTAVFTGHEHYYERWREIIRENSRPIHILNWVVTGLGGVKPRGSPEYEEEEIEELLEEDEVYRHYLARISELDPNWTAELQHAYPTEESPSARFHNYLLITVDGSEVWFQTKDKWGSVRDEGFFSPADSVFRRPTGNQGHSTSSKKQTLTR